MGKEWAGLFFPGERMGRPILSPGKKLTGGKFRPVTPGWSQVDYLLEYLTNYNIFLFFILFGIFVDNKIKKSFYQIGFSSENFDY